MIIRNIKLLYLLDVTPKERKTIFMSSLSGLVEFYDFIIFGLMGVYFARVIFRYSDMGSWNVFILFMIFILGYMVKPIGMKIYSQCATCYSSRRINITLITALFVSSLVIGLLPSYSEIGVFSPILLMIARVLQGIASGAELQGEYDHLSIKMTRNHSFAILGFITGNEIGQLLGVFAYRGVSYYFNQAQLEAYGWRIPFFIGCALITIVFIIRVIYGEPISDNYQNRSIMPSYKLLGFMPAQTLSAMTLSGIKGGFIFLYLVLVPFSMWYFMGYSYQKISHIIFITTILSTILVMIINPLITFINSPTIIKFSILLVLPAILLLAWSFINNQLIYLSVFVIATLSNIFTLTVPRVISGLFPPALRLYGVTFSHQNGFVLFGGLIPLFNIAIGHLVFYFFHDQIKNHHVFFISLISYFLLITIISLIALKNLNKYANYDDLVKLSEFVKKH
jgi:MFS family permease